MFYNTHQYSMDKKGRVSIPAQFRESLQELGDTKIALTIYQAGAYRYLLALPHSLWLTKAAGLEGRTFDPQSREFRRYLMSRMEVCPLDKQGRILISPQLRDYAGLTKDLSLAGVGQSFEIWDRQAFDNNFNQMDETIGEEVLQRLDF
ncbi:MAG: division/cell wall cluster transcriptional repressor MraZ [Thermodesulfobacteriota bacterium]